MRTQNNLMFIAFAIMVVMLTISGCKDKEIYTVTFDANGGTGAMAEQIFTEGESQALAKNSFTRDNYVFTNWSVMKDGSGTIYSDGETITVTFDMTLYAQWKSTNSSSNPESISYVTIIFDANGGTGEMLPMSFVPGETHILTTNVFTKENYWFAGWNTATNGTGTAYADSQEITTEEDVVLYAQWSLGVTGNVNGHNYVDLGLPSGKKWATCNVGADSPIAYGDYFAWGEITPKETYDWSTYIWCNGEESTITKYSDNPNEGYNGYTDNLRILLPEDDAAAANWDANWRTPTFNEMSELRTKCSVTWTPQNGVNGRLFTGPNGNSIFLPAAGNRYNGIYGGAETYGSYWCSNITSGFPTGAKLLFFDSNCCVLDNGDRSCGQPVRAILAE